MNTESVTKSVRREEKVIFFKHADIRNLRALYQLCQEHRVQLVLEDASQICLGLSEKSLDLPSFAKKIADYDLLGGMDEERRGAFLLDLSTLECA